MSEAQLEAFLDEELAATHIESLEERSIDEAEETHRWEESGMHHEDEDDDDDDDDDDGDGEDRSQTETWKEFAEFQTCRLKEVEGFMENVSELRHLLSREGDEDEGIDEADGEEKEGDGSSGTQPQSHPPSKINLESLEEAPLQSSISVIQEEDREDVHDLPNPPGSSPVTVQPEPSAEEALESPLAKEKASEAVEYREFLDKLVDSSALKSVEDSLAQREEKHVAATKLALSRRDGYGDSVAVSNITATVDAAPKIDLDSLAKESLALEHKIDSSAAESIKRVEAEMSDLRAAEEAASLELKELEEKVSDSSFGKMSFITGGFEQFAREEEINCMRMEEKLMREVLRWERAQEVAHLSHCETAAKKFQALFRGYCERVLWRRKKSAVVAIVRIWKNARRKREKERIELETARMRMEEANLKEFYLLEVQRMNKELEAMRLEEDDMKRVFLEELESRTKEMMEMKREDAACEAIRSKEREDRSRELREMSLEEEICRRCWKVAAAWMKRERAEMLAADMETRAHLNEEREQRMAEVRAFEQEDAFAHHHRTFMELVEERTRQMIREQVGSTTLDLSHKSLDTLFGFDTIQKWTSVDLSHNNFLRIPNLPAGVKKVCVAHNKLRSFCGTARMAQLEQLDCSSNQLKSLEDLDQCSPNLLCLSACANRLSSPVDIQTLPALVSLDLSGNTIDVFPWESLSKNCPLLQFLDLSSNHLQVGPRGLKLELLMTLYMRNNKLRDYMEEPARCVLPLLETLDLSWNQISNIHCKAYAEVHPALKSIDLSHNQLTSHNTVAKLRGLYSSLRKVNIEGNPLETPPLELGGRQNTTLNVELWRGTQELGGVYTLLRQQVKSMGIRDISQLGLVRSRIQQAKYAYRYVPLVQAMFRGMCARSRVLKALTGSTYDDYDEKMYQSVDVDSFLEMHSMPIPPPIEQVAPDSSVKVAWGATKPLHPQRPEEHDDEAIPDQALPHLEINNVRRDDEGASRASRHEEEKSTVLSEESQLSSRSYQSSVGRCSTSSRSHRFVVERQDRNGEFVGRRTRPQMKTKTKMKITHDTVLRDRLNNRKANARRRKHVPAWARRSSPASGSQSWLPPIR